MPPMVPMGVGVPAAVVAETEPEAVPVPMALVAETVNEYFVPGVRPPTVALVADAPADVPVKGPPGPVTLTV